VSITPAYPGVYIQELPSAVHAIIGVATSIAAFVGYTEADIDNRAQGVSASAQFERWFGGLASDSELTGFAAHDSDSDRRAWPLAL
jgi:phage tail sheath protein FI